MSEELETKVQELILVNNSWKKSINKVYRQQTLLSKRSEVQTLYSEIQELILENKDKLTDIQLNYFEKTASDNFQSALEISNEKLANYQNNQELNMALDVTTAAKLAELIPAYNGCPEGARSFIDALNFVNSVTTESQKEGAIQLALTKLTGKARDLFSVNPQKLDDIINKINTNCADKSSSDLVLATLKNQKQKKKRRYPRFHKTSGGNLPKTCTIVYTTANQSGNSKENGYKISHTQTYRFC